MWRTREVVMSDIFVVGLDFEWEVEGASVDRQAVR